MYIRDNKDFKYVFRNTLIYKNWYLNSHGNTIWKSWMISGSNFKERAHFAYFAHSKIFICYDIDNKLETRGNTNMTALTNFPKNKSKFIVFFSERRKHNPLSREGYNMDWTKQIFSRKLDRIQNEKFLKGFSVSTFSFRDDLTLIKKCQKCLWNIDHLTFLKNLNVCNT